jgi:hypothetical protein
MTAALVQGEALADSIRRRPRPAGSPLLARNVQLQDLSEAAGVATARERLLGVVVAAEKDLLSLCNAFKFKYLGTMDMPRSCNVLDIGPDGAGASLSQAALAKSLADTVIFFEKLAESSDRENGKIDAPNEVLRVGELVDLEQFRRTGSAVFDLLAPDATLADLRPSGSFSGARFRRGPYWCTDAVKLDAIEMRSVGILLFNSKGELLGPESGSGYVSVDIKLEGPFTKTWLGNVTAFKLPAFNKIFYSYSKPKAGTCLSGSPTLGGILCEASAQGQPNESTQALPSPYARWNIKVTTKAGLAVLSDVADIAIIADLVGVRNALLECRPPVVPYSEQATIPPQPDGGLSATAIALIVSSLVLAALASAAVVVRQRRARASGAPIDDAEVQLGVVGVNPVFGASPAAAAVDQQDAA